MANDDTMAEMHSIWFGSKEAPFHTIGMHYMLGGSIMDPWDESYGIPMYLNAWPIIKRNLPSTYVTFPSTW
jgi:hypothetical protein